MHSIFTEGSANRTLAKQRRNSARLTSTWNLHDFAEKSTCHLIYPTASSLNRLVHHGASLNSSICVWAIQAFCRLAPWFGKAFQRQLGDMQENHGQILVVKVQSMFLGSAWFSTVRHHKMHHKWRIKLSRHVLTTCRNMLSQHVMTWRLGDLASNVFPFPGTTINKSWPDFALIHLLQRWAKSRKIKTWTLMTSMIPMNSTVCAWRLSWNLVSWCVLRLNQPSSQWSLKTCPPSRISRGELPGVSNLEQEAILLICKFRYIPIELGWIRYRGSPSLVWLQHTLSQHMHS